MTREELKEIIEFMGRDKISRGNGIWGGKLFSFRALKKERTMLDIEKAISEKKSNSFIVRHYKVNERTMRRYRRKSYLKK